MISSSGCSFNPSNVTESGVNSQKSLPLPPVPVPMYPFVPIENPVAAERAPPMKVALDVYVLTAVSYSHNDVKIKEFFF